jgi:hypothetical protein
MRELFNAKPKLVIRDVTFEVHGRDPRYVAMNTKYGGTLAHDQNGICRIFEVHEIAAIRDFCNRVLPLEHTRNELPKARAPASAPAKTARRAKGRAARPADR